MWDDFWKLFLTQTSYTDKHQELLHQGRTRVMRGWKLLYNYTNVLSSQKSCFRTTIESQEQKGPTTLDHRLPTCLSSSSRLFVPTKCINNSLLVSLYHNINSFSTLFRSPCETWDRRYEMAGEAESRVPGCRRTQIWGSAPVLPRHWTWTSRNRGLCHPGGRTGNVGSVIVRSWCQPRTCKEKWCRRYLWRDERVGGWRWKQHFREIEILVKKRIPPIRKSRPAT